VLLSYFDGFNNNIDLWSSTWKKNDNEVITMMEVMMSKNIKLVTMMNMDLPQGS
jgi:hypothetical protein